MFNILYHSAANMRADNEDNFFWGVYTLSDSPDDHRAIGCVADGMGGLEKGKYTSYLAANAVRESVKEGKLSLEELKEIPLAVHQNVPQRSGTTLDIIHLYSGTFDVVHIGDSRVYKIPAGTQTAHPITKDHSAIQEFKDRGIEITPEMSKKYASKITRGIGKSPFSPPDVYSGSYETGDSFLICSDGFWHTFEANGHHIDTSNPDILEELSNLATASGEGDNITAVLIKVEEG